MKLGSIEKDKQPSTELMRLFEKTRVAYLSATHDPKEYSGRWRKAVELIEESYEELDAAGKELKNFLEEDEITDKEVKDPTSSKARNLFEKIKLVRYNSKIIADPFAEMFKGNVLEELLDNPESMVKFVHYAMREDNKALSPDILAIKDMEPDTITQGLMGLDLESDDIALYIIEHYGDGKDSKKVEKKVKAAMDMLELIFFSQHEEKEWDNLKDISMQKSETKSEKEKSVSDFIIPNKPMYRIFEINDINELKGFSGNWYIQEKYDGMRVQLHKIDNKVKVFSYNEKDITSKCDEIVKELKKKEYGNCIFDAELVLFDGEEPLHRADTIAHVFKGKYKDAKLKCHVFDIMRHESQTLLDEELENRMTILFNNYAAKSSEYLHFPSKKDTRQADSLKDLEAYSKEIMEIPTAEGVVIKDSTSTYYIGTKKNPKWIKLKKFVDLDVIVLDKKKTKSNLYSYTVGVGPIPEDMEGQEIDGKKYLNVGKALNTKVAVDVGDIIRVKVDEVKKKGEGYSLFSAKVIEIPEVEHPDKLVTLELLSQDTKKSLNYNVEAFTKGVKITDYIHGEATAIIKYDTDGFTIYGFEENNLMSKNALVDLDMWKAQAEEIMKTKQGELTVAIVNFLKEKGDKSPKEVHQYLKRKMSGIYEDVLESKEKKLGKWAQEREHISMVNNKLHADPSVILAEAEEIKKSVIRKKQQLLQRLKEQEKEQEKEEEIPIDIDSDMEGDCCTQLKNNVIEYKREMLEYLLEGTSWEALRNTSKSGTFQKFNSLEEAMDDFSDYMMNRDCERLVRFYLNPEKIERDKEILDEYNQCQFGSGFSDKYAMLKAYKTPNEYRKGKFKIYNREDDNIHLSIRLGKEVLNWTIDLEGEKELFDLFGAAGKYPAEVSKNIERGKVIDSGDIELGVQKDGYHEYFLKGNKFETKLHIRLIPVDNVPMWLAWTGYKQEPADTDSDTGKWNIYEDKYSKTSIPREN